jgi:putative endonuclease
LSTPRQFLGRWGETLAAEYLQQRGYTILERNVRTPYGEIDLVASESSPPGDPLAEGDSVTVFVEVKTRASLAFGMPEDSITVRKRAHLLSAAQSYLQGHPELEHAWRIDVIAIQRLHLDSEPVIHHFENAISG